MALSTEQTTKLQQANRRLAEYKHLIDEDIAAYSSVVLRQWEQAYGSVAAMHLQPYLEILSRGGKRLRGALAMHAYELAGGKDTHLAKVAARSIEAIHAYLLVVDDVADRSSTRRGGPTAHIQIARLHQESHWRGDSKHYGEAQAVHAALAGAHLAIQEVAELPVKDSYKLKALSALNSGLATTVAGQIRDVYNQVIQNIPEVEVRQVLTMKTAYYSFLNPLEFGLSLAGKDLSDYAWLKAYAIHVGLGFQVIDDILGTFGNPEKSGKGATDDLSEGKITVLISRALEKATPSQRRQLLSVLGKQTVTPKDHALAKEIIESTGALEYSYQLANDQVILAIKTLKAAPSAINTDFLAGLAAYILKRNN